MIKADFNTGYSRPLVMGLGFFDSVHYGHRRIIERVHGLAAARGAESALFTFSNNAYKQFNGDAKVIYTFSERKKILARLGIDCLVNARFDKTFKDTDKTAFLDALTSRFAICGFVCGYDYLFGAGGEGDTEYLSAYCRKKGIALEVVDPVELDGERVSSTDIKQYLVRGELEKANRFLVEPFFMCGSVVKGRGEGGKYGFPTANMIVPPSKLIVKHGVYGTVTVLDGQALRSVTNVGYKPTFDDMSLSVETFIAGEPGELYGKEITVRFMRYIRETARFSNPASLGEQIHKDMEWCHDDKNRS